MLKFNFETYMNIDDMEIKKFLVKKDKIKESLFNASMNGWLKIDDDIEEIIKTADKIKENSDLLIVIGIGGSYMGCCAIDQLFKKYFKDDKFEIIYAGYNLSKKYMDELLDYIKDKDITINFISKSGTTMEPNLAYDAIYKLMKKKYSKEELVERIIITTDEKEGLLREQVDKNGYKSFVIPSNVGGRYSVLTNVGLLPLALVVDIKRLLSGAKNSIKYFDDAYYYACLRNTLFKNKRYVENFVVYEPSMYYFTEWLKQLFGETEGKNGVGILPISTVNARDLHSLGQFLQEGNPIIFETVFKIENDHLNNLVLESVAKAHFPHTPTNIITLDKLDEYNIGELIYFFYLSASLSGYLMGIDPFDQPGVEAYKEEVKKALN